MKNFGLVAGAALVIGGFLMSKQAGEQGGEMQDVGTAIPSQFDALFNRYGDEQGVPPKWLKAICMNESSLGQDPRVQAGEVSADGLSYGIMQLTVPTANDFEDVTSADLNDPETSVRIAAKFFHRIMKSFDLVDLRYQEWCVKSYNQGIKGTQDERDGTSEKVGAMANAQRYWERFQRNLASLG